MCPFSLSYLDLETCFIAFCTLRSKTFVNEDHEKARLQQYYKWLLKEHNAFIGLVYGFLTMSKILCR